MTINAQINSKLRGDIKKYLRSPGSVGKNEMERRVSLGKGTLSKFIKGAAFSFDHEKRRKLYSIIYPAKFDKVVIAGDFRKRLLISGFLESEIHEITGLVGSNVPH